MSSEPQAFVTVDHGTATIAVALIGRVERRWRLLGATAAPAQVAAEALIERLRGRVAIAEPGLAAALGVTDPGATATLPRVACATAQPPEIAVLAATSRALEPLASAAASAGWRVNPGVIEHASPPAVAGLLANPRAGTILAGAGDPPGADERGLMAELVAQLGAAAVRRPDVTLVLTGSLVAPGSRYEVPLGSDRPGPVIAAPAADASGGAALRRLLDGLRATEDDGRRALAVATGTLAEVLRRPVEVLEIGHTAGLRAVADHAPGEAAEVDVDVVAQAALLPRGFTDAHLDAIAGWLTVPLDRLRLRDRLRELALAPWGDGAGEGIELRLAAARAALIRLQAATARLDRVPAELIVAAGGVFSAAPPTAVALALTEAIRRPGIRALAVDHARLLAPLGTIDDPDERRQLMTDLRDELLVPLGTVVMPAGLRLGRSAGQLVLERPDSSLELGLEPGAIERIPLAPGELAVAELQFRDAPDVGVRTRRMAAELSGGLAGVLVDLRDVPLRLPDRPERRRETLAEWQRSVVPEGGR